MENEFMKRGYLLPKGCKDLSDVAKLKHKHVPDSVWAYLPQKVTFYNPVTKSYKQFPTPLPPVTRQVFIQPNTTVRKLADLLGQKPFEIIGDVMKFGVFASVDEVLDFKIIAFVARMHGYEAIKAA